MAGDNTSKIPNWAARFISSNDLAKISAAVKKAEANTTGEIIPMLVSRSSQSHMVPFTASLVWITILLLLISQQPDLMSVDRYWWVLPVLAVLGSAVAFLLGRTAIFQRLFTHPFDRHAQVIARAELEFHRQQLDKHAEHSAVLIFASAFERDVVVLADEKIAAKLPKETWAEVVAILVRGFRSNEASHGWVRAIETCGEILARHLPSPAHTNNFNDSLILKD